MNGDSFRNMVIFAQNSSFLSILDAFPIEYGVFCANPQGQLVPCGSRHFADVPLGKLAKNPRFIGNTENTWILMKFQQNQVFLNFLCVYGKMVNFVVKYSVWSRLDTLQSQL